MKTLIQKVNVPENQCFVCRTYRTPHFETNLHQHPEAELILITEGQGKVMIGDFVGEYTPGNVYYISSNIPHWFRKNKSFSIGSAIVAQFDPSIFGTGFLENPELINIHRLLEKNEGIQLEKKLQKNICLLLKELEKSQQLNSILLLLSALNEISNSKQKNIVTKNFFNGTSLVNPVIEKIMEYTFRHYLEPIKLKEVADYSKMTIPTFCRFFKKNIKKTYFEFLQELRVNHACKLLRTSEKPILEICYESGYNSWAHFSKQFKQLKQRTPTQYKTAYKEY